MLSYGSEIRAQAPFTVTRLSDFMDGYPMVTKILFDYIQPYEVSGLKDKEIASLGGFPFKGDDINLTLDISCGARMIPSVDNKNLVVLGVAPMSPAARLGLQPMDIILKINGKNSFKRKDMSNKGYSLLEKDVTLGALAEEIANVAYIMTHGGLTKGYPPFLKSMGFPILEKSENEFLIERNGKKIKLKGNLWNPSLYNVKPKSFLKTARYIANPVFHEYIRMQFK